LGDVGIARQKEYTKNHSTLGVSFFESYHPCIAPTGPAFDLGRDRSLTEDWAGKVRAALGSASQKQQAQRR